MAATILVVPMYAPYNQVLLLPAIFFLVKEASAGPEAARVGGPLLWATVLALGWQWIASLALSALWFASRDAALLGWKVPLYATFALPVLVFMMTLLAARHPASVLRVRASAE